MNIAFSIDALSASGDKSWRLMRDQRHWRPITFADDLKPEDARMENLDDVRAWMGRRLVKDKEFGLVPKGRPGIFDFLMRGIFAHAIVHRFSPAPIPDRGELEATLRKATPGRPWLIHLDLAGHFRAIDTSSRSILNDPAIAVRGEIASSSAYVGEDAAASKTYIETLYRQFLAGWLQHLQTRRVGIFVPDAERTEDDAVLKRAIEAWKPEKLLD